jgi:hypothetical protein
MRARRGPKLPTCGEGGTYGRADDGQHAAGLARTGMAPAPRVREPGGTLDVEREMLAAVALTLGDLSRSEPPALL